MSNRVAFAVVAKDMFSGPARRIKGSLRGVSQGVKKVNQDARAARGGMKKLGVGFKAMAKVAKASALLAVTAIASLGVALKAVVSTGADFEDSMADLSSITGATGKELGFLREESLKLAKGSAIDAGEVANAFKLVASGKSSLLKDPQALSNVTKEVLLLKNATGMELSNAADIAVTSLNQFELGAEHASRVVNVLAAGSKYGASEVAETGAALKKAGVAALAANVGFEETNAMVQVLAANGLKAENAGTMLKTVLLKLETSANDKLKPSLHGVANVLESLARVSGDATKMKKLFGEEAFAAGKILVDNVGQMRDLTTALSNTSIAEEQAAIRLDTFNAKMRKIGILIKDVLIRAFIRLKPEIDLVVTKITTWVESISTEDVNAFVDQLKDVGTWLLTVGENASYMAGKIAPALRFMGLLPDAPVASLAGGAGGFKSGLDVNTMARAKVDIGIKDPGSMVSEIQQPSSGKGMTLDVGYNNEWAL